MDFAIFNSHYMAARYKERHVLTTNDDDNNSPIKDDGDNDDDDDNDDDNDDNDDNNDRLNFFQGETIVPGKVFAGNKNWLKNDRVIEWAPF